MKKYELKENIEEFWTIYYHIYEFLKFHIQTTPT